MVSSMAPSFSQLCSINYVAMTFNGDIIVSDCDRSISTISPRSTPQSPKAYKPDNERGITHDNEGGELRSEACGTITVKISE